MARNPFPRVIPPDQPLCGREEELRLLLEHARAGTNVVLSGARRMGKTTLVRRVQEALRREDGLTVFCDLYGVASVEDMAVRVARAILTVTEPLRGLRDKARKALLAFRPVIRADGQGLGLTVEPAQTMDGLALLESALDGLARLLPQIKGPTHVALDEFQEIREVERGLRIQGLLRARIQEMNASFFFVGSRRRLLEDMFTDRKKPFYQSAAHVRLGPVEDAAVERYAVERFASAGVTLAASGAAAVARLARGNPFYLQRLCSRVFDSGGRAPGEAEVLAAWSGVLEENAPLYTASIQGLSIQQKRLLAAVAKEPAAALLGNAYVARWSLGSVSGVQRARDVLAALDLIAQDQGAWRVVDPGLADWLMGLYP